MVIIYGNMIFIIIFLFQSGSYKKKRSNIYLNMFLLLFLIICVVFYDVEKVIDVKNLLEMLFAKW